MQQKRAIECDHFPFEKLSEIAEVESWRKEVNRPIYHIHKWWAQRLGSVFRAIILGAHLPTDADVIQAFYSRVRFPKSVIFDPFMGSGTTIGEALKTGARAIGRDINPVAHFLVRNALRKHSRSEIERAFREVENDVAGKIQNFYRARDPKGNLATALYYFWVKQLNCPACSKEVDLFASYVFARHAYPKRFPIAQSVCPCCGGINEILHDAKATTCATCSKTYCPQEGPARGTKACCPACGHNFVIIKEVRAQDKPPHHRLYAKLLLTSDGEKVYASANDFDIKVFKEAQLALKDSDRPYPIVAIDAGYNTNQAINYNYRFWHQMFNERQLACLHILGQRIRQIEDTCLKELFICLFSGALEFNNMFASYKGEGTGAVRHMFSHHILKPERTPLEANLWGTPKSSGSFSTLFGSRILRALDYADSPFELRAIKKGERNAGEKLFGLSEPLGREFVENFKAFKNGASLYLSCGDSSQTDIESESVDAVITDPPFFDNVHYSELADFFYVWQRHLLSNNWESKPTTRSIAEVQHAEQEHFTERLGNVWKECYRVLKKSGLLIFSYHHSRSEGWCSMLKALMSSSFLIVAAHPVKGEMSGATPKHQAKEPIDIDIIFVCRKRQAGGTRPPVPDLFAAALVRAESQVERLRISARLLSRNDLRVIVMAQVLRELSCYDSSVEALALLTSVQPEIDLAVEKLKLRDERMVA